MLRLPSKPKMPVRDCPFCGAYGDSWMIGLWGGPDGAHISCSRCGAEGPLAQNDDKVEEESLALEGWNHRGIRDDFPIPPHELLEDGGEEPAMKNKIINEILDDIEAKRRKRGFPVFQKRPRYLSYDDEE